jgi:ribonuclease P/MRP protein subunit POP8
MGPIYRPNTRTWAIQAPSTAAKADDAAHPDRNADADADADTSMVDAIPAGAQNAPASTSAVKKRKRKEKETHILHETTFRKPIWSYFHLTLVTPGTASQTPSASAAPSDSRDVDALTVSTLLLQPLTAYLGITGSAVPIDILHTQGRNAYVRIPRQDARAFRAGLSGWIGGCDAGSVPGVKDGGRVNVAWRVVAEGGSLGLLSGAGEELFGEDGIAY